MPRRLALRVRTILFLIVWTSLGLAYVAHVWRRGGFGFQKRHAAVAYEQLRLAEQSRHAVHIYAAHEADGHSCPACSVYGRPARELRERAVTEFEAHERRFRWHALLAGPAFRGLYGVSL